MCPRTLSMLRIPWRIGIVAGRYGVLASYLPVKPLNRQFSTTLVFQHRLCFLCGFPLCPVDAGSSAGVISLVLPTTIGAMRYGAISILAHLRLPCRLTKVLPSPGRSKSEGLSLSMPTNASAGPLSLGLHAPCRYFRSHTTTYGRDAAAAVIAQYIVGWSHVNAPLPHPHLSGS